MQQTVRVPIAIVSMRFLFEFWDFSWLAKFYSSAYLEDEVLE